MHLNWLSKITTEDVTAWATAATTVIAAVAAGVALFEYRRSRALLDLETNLRLMNEATGLLDRQHQAFAIDDDEERERRVASVSRDFLNHCEIYAAAYLRGSLPSLSAEFISDYLQAELLPLLNVEPFDEMLKFDPSKPRYYSYIRAFANHYGYKIEDGSGR